MLRWNFKKMNSEIYSPVIGRCISLENVPDEVFANKLLGEGVAFEFAGDTIYSPCDGEVVLIASTKHALGLRTKNGMEIILHVGLDTVNLNGEGIQLFVKKHTKVKVKDILMKLDRTYMNEKKVNLITPLVITNADDYNLTVQSNKDKVDLDSIVMLSTRKGAT